MTQKEVNRWLRNLAGLKYKWHKNAKKGNKYVAQIAKSKYYWFLKRLVKMAEQNASGWE